MLIFFGAKAYVCTVQDLEEIAATVTHSVNLHKKDCEAALMLVKIVLKRLKKKNPRMARLTVITGQGWHSKGRVPIIKNKLIDWLKMQQIKFEIDYWNPGRLTIAMKSVKN